MNHRGTKIKEFNKVAFKGCSRVSTAAKELTDDQQGQIVILNYSRCRGRADCCSRGGVRKVYREGFIRLDQRVAVDVYVDGLAGIAGSEAERAVGRLVIASGYIRAISGGVIHHDARAA